MAEGGYACINQVARFVAALITGIFMFVVIFFGLAFFALWKMVCEFAASCNLYLTSLRQYRYFYSHVLRYSLVFAAVYVSGIFCYYLFMAKVDDVVDTTIGNRSLTDNSGFVNDMYKNFSRISVPYFWIGVGAFAILGVYILGESQVEHENVSMLAGGFTGIMGMLLYFATARGGERRTQVLLNANAGLFRQILRRFGWW
jgi:hypothetical protein